MLKKIELENFKSFKSLKNLEIKPITILCGTNSCGKSSILQSLMLQKQTFESQSNSRILLLNGKYIHLGLLKNIVYEKKSTNIINLDYSFKFDKTSNKFNLKHFMKSLASAHNNEDVDLNNATFNYNIKFKSVQKSKSNQLKKPLTILEYNIIFSFPSKINKDKNYETSILLKNIQDDTYKVEWKNLKLIDNLVEDEHTSGSIRAILKFNNFLPNIIRPIKGYEENISELFIFFWRYKDFMMNIFKTFSYIGPLREEASRRYIYEDEITEIGVKGQNSAYLYFNEAEKDVDNYHFYDKNKNEFFKKKSNLKEAVKEWLSLLGIEGFSSSYINDIIHLNLNANQHNNLEVNIADVGFGISQVLPIILEGLRISENHTLVLEQPEIHLHPKMQMEIADYFLSLAVSNKNIIMETHSEHIINRLVRRILEDNTNELLNLVAIYFISPGTDGSNYVKVEIDRMQGIVNWPENFFDQNAIEQEKILLAGLQKRRKMRDDN